MADIFVKSDACKLLKQKRVLFLGDSNIRALYKDFLQLTTANSLTTEKQLKAKLPVSFQGDELLRHTSLSKTRDFEEERLFDDDSRYIKYVFVTRCYSDRVENILKQLPNEIRPDLVVMNSCLWDITRWGPDGVDTYKENLHKLVQRFKESLSPNALVIWTTTLPVAQEMKGGFLIPQVEFMKYQLRYEVMEANFYTWQIFSENGFDVIDFHYHLQMQLIRRAADGVHWSPRAVRHMTNLVLTHVALAWHFPLPGRFSGMALQRKIAGPLLPDINAPALPPLSKHETASNHGSSSNQARTKKRKMLASRRTKSHSRSVSRSSRRSVSRCTENTTNGNYYYNNRYPERPIRKAVRRVDFQNPFLKRCLRDINDEVDVPIRAPWYK